jgi:translation initiation factor 1A
MKNKGKGGKNRKKGKGDVQEVKRELVFKEPGEEYAIITKLLGSCNVRVECADKEERDAHIRGAFRKKVWMRVGDLVLVSLRDYQDNKADVIHVYKPDEMRMLKSYQELPENFGASSAVLTDDVTTEEKNDEQLVEFVIDDI